MTPAAITPAGRGGTKKGAPGGGRRARAGSSNEGANSPAPRSGERIVRPGERRARSGERALRSDGHRAPVRARPAPAAPRRISGPLAGLLTAPSRRVRLPSAAPRLRPSAPPAPKVSAPRKARLRAAVSRLPDHAWLDRLVRGRVWIPLLGLMLAGIVAMQVEVLKLGASIGRSLQRTTTLQARNEQLRQNVASLADDQRIERMAARMGMVMPAPDGVGFLSENTGANVQRAIANIHAPNASAFLALASTNGSVTGSSTSSSATGSPAAGGTSASSSTSSTSSSSSSAGNGASSASGGTPATPSANAAGTGSTGGAAGTSAAGTSVTTAHSGGGAPTSASGGGAGLPASRTGTGR